MKDINIARTLIRKRKERGITQEDLACAMGVSKASVSKWETGQSYPDLTLLPQLATYFTISIDELMNYQPQMDKKAIRELYLKLSDDFSQKPFAEVKEEIDLVIKKYYACFPLLIQIVGLLLNYYTCAEAPDKQQEILEEIISLCHHIKAESTDFLINRQANSLEAISTLVMNHPLETIDLLDNTMAPSIPDDLTLAQAYQAQGKLEKSKEVLQIASYTHLLYLVGGGTQLLSLYQDDPERFEKILQRNLCVASTFNLDRLHPNAYFQFTSSAALGLLHQGNTARALDLLEQGIHAFENFHLPLLLHGDEYFDLLDTWFEEFPLGNNAPRDKKTIKSGLIGMMQSPLFEPLHALPRYKNLIKTVESLWKDTPWNT